jgi:hypothetical protein
MMVLQGSSEPCRAEDEVRSMLVEGGSCPVPAAKVPAEMIDRLEDK